MNGWVIVLTPVGYQLLKVVGYTPNNFVCMGPQSGTELDELIAEQEQGEQTKITAWVLKEQT